MINGPGWWWDTDPGPNPTRQAGQQRWAGPLCAALGLRTMAIENLVGKRFGRLVVIASATERTKSGRLRWLCRCDCGSEKSTQAINLKSGDTTSCGCVHKQQLIDRNTTHGSCDSPEYHTWCAMITRCTNANNREFKHYGGRGIKVCDRWRNFAMFLEDMGTRPTPKHSIDRINVNGDYEPTNCRWVTQAEQVRNTRRNILVDVDGTEMTVMDAAGVFGVNSSSIYSRIWKLGWSKEAAVNVPTRKMRRVTYRVDGVDLSIAAAAAAKGIKPTLIYDRLRYGWSLEDAFTALPNSRKPG